MIWVCQEPDSFKYIAPHKNKSEGYYRQFLIGKLEKNKPEVGFFTVYDKKDNTLIGTVNLNQFMDTKITHIGCHLSNAFWNQGYGLELMEAIMEYGFSVRKLNEIYAIIESGHAVSIKLFEKLNFKFIEEKVIEGSSLRFYKKLNP